LTIVAETLLVVKASSRFKKDLKRIEKQGLSTRELEAVVEKLANGVSLEPVYYDHALGGEYKGCRECHIRPDWLLIYEVDDNTLYLYLMRTGSHSELFSR
jgi:mRNA interferase YafQ